MNRQRGSDLKKLAEILGHAFADLSRLDQALTHRSYANEAPEAAGKDNERLEFLGDAVLALCVSDDLMARFPDATEGDLSKRRAALVSERALANLANTLGLGALLRLGRGEELTGGREKPSLLADALEAVVAAVYLDGGYPSARNAVDRMIVLAANFPEPDRTDAKSLLQKICRERFGCLPRYSMPRAYGPDHDRTYDVRLELPNDLFVLGTGKSRKEAERIAAAKALRLLGVTQDEG